MGGTVQAASDQFDAEEACTGSSVKCANKYNLKHSYTHNKERPIFLIFKAFGGLIKIQRVLL